LTIQIVEDDKALSDGIAITLSDENTSFKQEYRIKDAVSGFMDYGNTLSLIILDINLPDGTGYDYLRTVRSKSNLPVLILTANDMELDEVKSLTMGADDFLTKPFSLAVLRARVNALIRRSKVSPSQSSADSENASEQKGKSAFEGFSAGNASVAPQAPGCQKANEAAEKQTGSASVSASWQGNGSSRENTTPNRNGSSLIYKLDDMIFDFEKLTFKKQGEEIFLSVNEQRLLKLFLENKGCVLTRERLMERLWGEDGTFVDENTLSVTINRLRNKIDAGKDDKNSTDDKRTKHISTIYGQGYRFD